MLKKIDYDITEIPIRDEGFSSERLNQYAFYLAQNLKTTNEIFDDKLLKRVDSNCDVFVKNYKKLLNDLEKNVEIPPAGMWIVDNHFVIEEQIVKIKKDLPRKYYHELPKITNGELMGYPRIYSLALTLIAHLDSHLDLNTIRNFTIAFQQTTPLTSGEIWALPITLRIALLENLRRVTIQLMYTHNLKLEAKTIAEKIIHNEITEDLIKKELQPLIEDSFLSDSICIGQIYRQIREQSPETSPLHEIVHQYLDKKTLTIDEVIHQDHLHQAITQVTLGNIVTSMRLISSVDWQEFFEDVSPVEHILRQDPAHIYSNMDFQTRDRYRHSVERIARRTKKNETIVAEKVIEFSKHSQQSNDKKFIGSHVGFYLIDQGIEKLEGEFNYHQSVSELIRRNIKKYPNLFYFGLLILFQIIFLIIVYETTYKNWWPLFFIVSFIPVSDTSLNMLNFLTTTFLSPNILPKMELSDVPSEAKTFIVIPTIFKDKNAVIKMVETVEVHYLSNADSNLYYALLSDFSDADEAHKSEDEEILELADQLISDLNERYPLMKNHFFYFHRPRLWNACENSWMGWERKRGKIEQFNRFLRETDFNPFLKVFQKELREEFKKIKFVISLDSDTQMPRDSAKKLIGTILHPLNSPQLTTSNQLERGYVILQPRISIKPTSSCRSYFSLIYSGNTGIDPYTTAVSDVYQDLYGEGIFVGKGLYCVEEFSRLTDGRVKENTILSHDLFEGLMTKTALITDVEFLDDYPLHYESYSKRMHRWVRGDWQIYPWIFSLKENTFNFVSRWKIFDNLRRSLVPVFFLLWFFFIFTLSDKPFRASLVVLLIFMTPVLFQNLRSFFHFLGTTKLIHIIKNTFINLRLQVLQSTLFIAFLPHQAFVNMDAIIRTLYRVHFSKKNLLEWTTAEEIELKIYNKIERSHSITIIVESLVIFIFSATLLISSKASLAVASPFLILWFFLPLIIRKISREKTDSTYLLSENDKASIRLIARRTWHYFETFVTETDHWLAPDNFQEDPRPVVAHRTSPTNIGAMLLSTASAYDFGFLTSLEALERLEKTQLSLNKLEKYHGHLYNWYDTTTLKPLYPIYISTVDSGNLAAFLITMKVFCEQLAKAQIIEKQIQNGMHDILLVLKEEMLKVNPRYFTSPLIPKSKNYNEFKLILDNVILFNNEQNPSTILEWLDYSKQIKKELDQLFDLLQALILEHGEVHFHDLPGWIKTAHASAEKLEEHIHYFLPFQKDQISDLESACQNFSLLKNELYISSIAELYSLIDQIKYVNEIHKIEEKTKIIFENLNSLSEICESESVKRIIQNISKSIEDKLVLSNQFLSRIKVLGTAYQEMAFGFDFKFLYNIERKIFSIGYNLSEGRMDNAYYDLLASEARLASFFAIAKGDLPLAHWFHLGRQMSSIHGRRALISWTASMFEYLMPLLVMKNYDETLLHQTYSSIVKTQLNYTKNSNIPWGISESAYNARDLHQFYQYGPFGIPGLGLKFGLGSDTVISPYSTALAAMVSPKEAMENFEQLKNEKAFGKFGFYEAIDFTRSRLPKGQRNHIIRSFMVHHQGMILVSLGNVLNENKMQKRFHSEPMVKATELLLQEKIPAQMSILPFLVKETPVKSNLKDEESKDIRSFSNVETYFPQCNILSNGSYTVMTSTTGAGFSKYQDIAITRWNEDPTLDTRGSFIYLRDHLDDSVSSATYQPIKDKNSFYDSCFSEYKSEFTKRSSNITVHTEIIVSAEDNIELRRMTISNTGSEIRNFDCTSYLEPVFSRPQDDFAHLSFNKLFLETEYIHSRRALLIKRRKRFHEDKERWGIHSVVTDGNEYSPTQYETDRLRFIGRNRSYSDPLVIMENLALSNTTGTVLDPILSLRKCLTLSPHSTVHVCYATGYADSKEEALKLIDHYHDIQSFNREQDLSWTQNQVKLRHLGIQIDEALLFQELASALIYANPLLRPGSEKLHRNKKPQEGLWAFGISGDIPLLTVMVRAERDLPIAKLILRAHEYLRFKNIPADLVILNEENASYRTSVHDEIIRQINLIGVADRLNKSAGIFLVNSTALTPEEKNLFLSYSKIVIDSNKGSLSEQIQRIISRPFKIPTERTYLSIKTHSYDDELYPLAVPKMNFFNGLGGFNEDGSEYLIYIRKGLSTPAPWINVIANENNFGFIISDSGSSYTWANNSRENRLTPWHNDPVTDAGGEAIYIRDEETFKVWSPTPWPINNSSPYLIAHGQGYSRFTHNDHGISHEYTVFTSLTDNVKIGRLKLKNICPYQRKLSCTFYAEWVLGINRIQSALYLLTEKLESQNCLLARNPFSNEFHQQIAYCAMNGSDFTYTGDRREFLGRNESYATPDGMKNKRLKETTAAGLDPCATLRSFIFLEPNEEKEIIILLGQENDREKIKNIVSQYLEPKKLDEVYNHAKEFWRSLNQTIQIQTPSKEFDFMINHWLIYQTLSCRMWARTALYQSGGAYGFRDQLQDSLALLYSKPEIARAHILKSAAQQFKEGDVQHWWHPPSNKGVRTKFSDDLLWLPYVICKYLEKTNDWSILEEKATFIEAPLLKEGQEDLYIAPSITPDASSIYDHCLRAITRSLKVGSHGLPLMGAGDWNDGMNNVGLKGTGESVWVAWFLSKILNDFSAVCLKKGDKEQCEKFKDHSAKLVESIEKNAWDGEWYMRAFFDDGTPLGSSQNDECQIDSLTQSWSVITGNGNKERAFISMNAVDKRLVLKKERLCLLFTPPFDKGVLKPGYIKGYPPGIRENGGQYSHAAAWSAMAFALLKENDKAFEVLSFLNPVTRTKSFSGLQLYKVEPYVLAADIYDGNVHTGRGGWSWYTGSSSLFYQAGLEYILGMKLNGNTLSFSPCVPYSWNEFKLNLKWKNSLYQISIIPTPDQSTNEAIIKLDGQTIAVKELILIDDEKVHQVQFSF